MITYIGNKRKLVDTIEDVVKRLKPETFVDAFSGSGVVSRMFLTHCKKLYVNDLERYCEVLSQCFLKTPSWCDQEDITEHINCMNTLPAKNGLPTPPTFMITLEYPRCIRMNTRFHQKWT